MKNRFKLIIFDWDGTLVDSIDWIVHCLQTAATDCHCEIPSPSTIRDIIGLSIGNAIKTLFPKADGELTQRLIKSYSQEYFSKQITPQDLFPGVKEMLTILNESGYKLAVATGKGRPSLDKALNATCTSDFFCVSRCADETASKPDPKMIEEIMLHTNIKAEHTLMIGDSIHDLQMAQNANISAIGVSCGAHPKNLLQQYQPLLCLNQTTELLEIMKG